MATISSTGIGSGLDVNSIVSQLVALEKQPLKLLAVKATNVQSQISGFGQVQSQFAALTDVATRISDPAVWIARNASSSNPAAATIAVTSTANATSFSLDVDALAGTQSVASPGIATGTKPGAGTLTLQLGMWTAANPGGTSPTTTPTFGAGAAASVSLTVASTDTIAMIAANINKLNMGVVATAFNDGTNDRLLLSSKSTGAAAGFKVTSADAALSGLVFDPQNSPASGMSSVGIPVQYGQDAKARINGLAVTSATNTLANNIPGVTINLLATTTPTTSVSMAISEDVTPGVKNVSDFVSAYNTLNTTLNDLTKYDAATKTAGAFQGDSSVVGLQNMLRRMLGSSSLGATSQHLSDVGIQLQVDGSLTIDTPKLSVAANNGTSLQQLFTNDNGNASTNGFALKFRAFGTGVAASGGAVTNKAAALQKALATNTAAQTSVTDKATLFETRLRAQYTALDVRMAQLNALNSYVTQQVTTWNKSTA